MIGLITKIPNFFMSVIFSRLYPFIMKYTWFKHQNQRTRNFMKVWMQKLSKLYVLGFDLTSFATGFCHNNLGSLIQSWNTSLNIKFGANRTFHVPKIPVYWFGFYGRYQILQTDEDNFWQSWYTILNIKFGKNRTFHMPNTPEQRFRYQIL